MGIRQSAEADDEVDAGSDAEGGTSHTPSGTPSRSIDRSAVPRQLDGKDSVLVLQFQGRGDGQQVQDVVAAVLVNALAREASTQKGPHGWVFYLALDRPHGTGLSTWIGIGKGIPPKVVDLIQKLLEATGASVHREYAVIAHHELRPFVAFTDDGAEAPSAGLTERELVKFEVPRVVRRPFVIDLAGVHKADQLAGLMSLPANTVAKRLPYFPDEGNATFAFGRLSFQMLARWADGSFTMMTKLGQAPIYPLSFDFGPERFDELLALLPAATRDALLGQLPPGGEQKMLRLPPDSVVAGVRAALAAPEPTDAVPLAALEFLPASEKFLFEIEF